eukprot:2288267-Rhodomonas_salina.2
MRVLMGCLAGLTFFCTVIHPSSSSWCSSSLTCASVGDDERALAESARDGVREICLSLSDTQLPELQVRPQLP